MSKSKAKKRTIARMTMVLPDGRKYFHREDFGEDYPEEYAYYAFYEGNYSCDCNRSLFLSRQYEGVEEMSCGETIQLEDFSVGFEIPIEQSMSEVAHTPTRQVRGNLPSVLTSDLTSIENLIDD